MVATKDQEYGKWRKKKRVVLEPPFEPNIDKEKIKEAVKKVKKKRITVKSAKARARVLQNWVADQISKITEIPVEKDGDVEPRQMGQSGVDVILRGRAQELFPFSIECKNAERWDVHGAIKQAKSNQKEWTNWICFFKRNYEDPIVILDAETFFKFFGQLIKKRKNGKSDN